MSIIFDIAAKRAELSADVLAIREVVTGQEITYRELNERANRFAEALKRLGIEAGQRIGILSHNNAAFFEILFACGKAGVILVPLNWRLTSAEIMPLLDDSNIDLMIHDANCAELARSLTEERNLTLIPIQTHGDPLEDGSYQSLLAQSTETVKRDLAWPTENIWYMLYTSGTTGIPKAVPQTFGMAISNYLNISQVLGLSPSSRSPNFLPLFHTAGINLHTLPIFIAGERLMFCRGLSRICSWIFWLRAKRQPSLRCPLFIRHFEFIRILIKSILPIFRHGDLAGLPCRILSLSFIFQKG